MPPKKQRPPSSIDIAESVADPAAYLFRCLEAQPERFRYQIEARRTDSGLCVIITDSEHLDARVRWHWRWTRHVSEAVDRAAEDDAYRQTLILMLDDGFIRPLAPEIGVSTG